jgi:Zn-dependent peptidase ImmA (M78 family)
MIPSERTVTSLASALSFPVRFFDALDLEELSAEAVSFRALSKMAAADRDRALAAGALAFAFTDWTEKRFKLPEPRIPKLGPGVDPETAAQVVRVQWNLGEKPAPNLIHLLEMRGIRVFSVTQECRELDAYSLWRRDQPFVFLNTEKSGERSRFDAAHELGHLVLHWHHDPPQGRKAELEAHRFAAAFLMPAASVLAKTPRHPTVEQLISLKKSWRVSVAALAHRLHALKALSDWQYRSLVIEIGKRNYLTSEPKPIERETSQVLNKLFAALRKEGMSKAAIARELQIHQADLDAIVFGLTMLPADLIAPLPAKPQPEEYPKLQLVDPLDT